ncbi:MAG: acetylglutamate kinase, partial [Gemmatimonadota bacterium]
MTGGASATSVVVKLGGSVLDGGALDAVLRGVARLHRRGFRCTVVHGGGPSVTRTLEELGVEPRFVDGLRVTDAETMDVVEMVLSGRVGPRIVGRLRALGVGAVGLSGVDGGLLTVRPHPDAGRLGRVGEVVSVDSRYLYRGLDIG